MSIERTSASGAGDSDPLLGEADSSGYRRPLPAFSTNASGLSANDPPGQGIRRPAALTGGMDRLLGNGDARRDSDLALALKSILGIWLLYFVLVTLRSAVLPYSSAMFYDMIGRRAVVALVGTGVTFLLYLALRPLREASLRKKGTIAALLCFPAATLYASFNYFVFFILRPIEDEKMDPSWRGMGDVEMAIRSIAEGALTWYFLFAAWAALYLAMSTQRQLRLADRRASALAREAQEAQLRALRYQINPHFLFNTLNSLSSLILSKRTDTAERMLMNLSTFFRATLSADPTADVSLEEEIRLQRLYLDIEQIRFPERLHVEVDVPDALLTARVPVLILQPVVENAVKYGVAKSRKPVTVRISAYEEAGRLHIKVKDDGDAAPADEDGGSTGVGLKNVCDRLTTRYGARAGCLAGADPDGGYTVHLYMPAARDG
jgi:two-component system LytT family sensor kinase